MNASEWTKVCYEFFFNWNYCSSIKLLSTAHGSAHNAILILRRTRSWRRRQMRCHVPQHKYWRLASAWIRSYYGITSPSPPLYKLELLISLHFLQIALLTSILIARFVKFYPCKLAINIIANSTVYSIV